MAKKKGTMTPVLPKSSARLVTAAKNRLKTPIVADVPEFIPQYETKGAACCDLKANLPLDLNGHRVLKLMPGHTVVVDCGFRIKLPASHEAQVRARSGWASKGVIVTNATDEQAGGGTIDEDYFRKSHRLKVILTNVGKNILVINHLERIAQMAIKPVWRFDFEAVEEFDGETDSDRTGGLGSTGVQ